MPNSFETYKREFGSVGTEEKDDNWGNRSCYLEKVFAQFLGFLQCIGIYGYQLRKEWESSCPIDDLENLSYPIDLEYFFVSVRDRAGNFFCYHPALCRWELTMDVDDRGTDRCGLGKVNEAAHKFLRDNYNGDSLLEELLLLFEHLEWIRSDCLVKRLRRNNDVGIGYWLEKYPFESSNKLNLKEELYKSQRERCTGCGLRLPMSHFDLDHIWPKSKGGKLVFGNVQCLCAHCNRSKNNKGWVHFLYRRAQDLRSDTKEFEQGETEPLF